jgi:hypothetical protein
MRRSGRQRRDERADARRASHRGRRRRVPMPRHGRAARAERLHARRTHVRGACHAARTQPCAPQTHSFLLTACARSPFSTLSVAPRFPCAAPHAHLACTHTRTAPASAPHRREPGRPKRISMAHTASAGALRGAPELWADADVCPYVTACRAALAPLGVQARAVCLAARRVWRQAADDDALCVWFCVCRRRLRLCRLRCCRALCAGRSRRRSTRRRRTGARACCQARPSRSHTHASKH